MGFITLNSLRRTLGNDPAETSEKVFSEGCDAGSKFIRHLVRTFRRRDIVLNAGTLEARESEIRLVEGLALAKTAMRDELNDLAADYARTHWLYTQAGKPWARNVPVYLVRMKVGGVTVENMACTDIQRPIVAAFWTAQNPEAEIVWNMM